MSTKNVLHNFETIDNEEKAYWLGFLYADGSVGSNASKIELGLAEKDLHQIKKFRDFIGLSNKISYRANTKSYRFSFRCDNMKQDLINKGCVPNKSLILKFPTYKQVPKNLMRHFIRGYFDGDGWFTNTSECFQVGLIGTEDFIKGFLNEIDNINKENKIFDVHRENGAKRYIISGLQDCYNFLSYMYDNSIIYLDRKYNHYKDFLVNGSNYHKTNNMPIIKEI